MRWVFGFLMLVATACGQRQDASLTDAGTERATAANESACAVDDDCGPGLLCETCGDGIFTCVPGCRTDAACGANMRCSHQVQCTTCPCPSGWCELDPCRDLDGDGFAAALEGTCPTRPVGDCNDALASVHPGGRERCANGLDDDCDGKTDARDDACRDSCPGSSFCASSIHCGPAKYCEQGCCDACPAIVEPSCAPTECALEAGVDEQGCRRAPTCAACASSCSTDREPVCGKNFATYLNACHALLAGTTVLHDGDCSYGEGMRCQDDLDCGYQTYCRALGAESHCARVGTCATDDDCKHVTAVVPCGDAGVAPWTCRNERCAASCP
jgi:hypothetical protein